jgi:hypothetical protein
MLHTRHFVLSGLVAGLAWIALPAGEAAAAPGDDHPVEVQQAFTVEVWHNAPVAAALTIYVARPNGQLVRLGTVSPSGTGRFELAGGARSGDHRLIAETVDRRRQTSMPFAPFEADGVSWDVDRNRLTYVWRPD